MNRWYGLFLAIVIAGGTPLSIGAEEVKMGYVDLQEALNSSTAGKKAKDIFKSEVDRIQVDLDKKQEELKKLSDEVEKKALMLSPETRDKKEKELREKEKELKRFFQDSQEKLQEKDAKLTRKIILELRDIIIAIGKEGAYTVIFESGDGNLLYVEKSIDLTEEVIKRYNKKK